MIAVRLTLLLALVCGAFAFTMPSNERLAQDPLGAAYEVLQNYFSAASSRFQTTDSTTTTLTPAQQACVNNLQGSFQNIQQSCPLSSMPSTGPGVSSATLDSFCGRSCMPQLVRLFKSLSDCVPNDAATFSRSLAALSVLCTKNPRNNMYCITLFQAFSGSLTFTNSSGVVDPLSSGCMALGNVGCCLRTYVDFINSETTTSVSDTSIANGTAQCQLASTPACPVPGVASVVIQGVWVITGLDLNFYNTNATTKFIVEYAFRQWVVRSLQARGATVTIAQVIVVSVSSSGSSVTITFTVAADDSTTTMNLRDPLQRATTSPAAPAFPAGSTTTSPSVDPSASSVTTITTTDANLGAGFALPALSFTTLLAAILLSVLVMNVAWA